ncbi:hypothetical protein D9M69_686930 [compost metagenome]
MTQAQSELALVAQAVVKFEPKPGFVGFREVHAHTGDGVVKLLGQGRAIVEKDAVQVPARTRGFL